MIVRIKAPEGSPVVEVVKSRGLIASFHLLDLSSSQRFDGLLIRLQKGIELI